MLNDLNDYNFFLKFCCDIKDLNLTWQMSSIQYIIIVKQYTVIYARVAQLWPALVNSQALCHNENFSGKLGLRTLIYKVMKFS